MKKYLFIILVFGFMGKSWGQEQFKIGQLIIFDTYVNHSLTNSFKNLVPNNLTILDTINFNPILLEPNIRFKIVDIDKDSVSLIVYPPINKLKDKKNVYDKSYYYNYRLFKVTKNEVLAKGKDASDYNLPDRFNIGILTLPFKFRSQGNKSFDSDFNLNSTLAYRIMSIGGGHLFVQIGAGIGGVELNEINSKGIDNKATIKANGLSFMTGLMLQYKKVQAGIYLGADHINNQTSYQWQYQGKPWLAFGVGYQLFNVGLGSGEKSSKQ